MADPFVAEIRIFPFTFAPKGWAFCDGQILPISQNTALFALIGTTYGGDGKSTFALPDLRGSTPLHPGQGPGLSQRFLGEIGGSQTITLLQSELPAHIHGLNAVNANATVANPGDAALARGRYSTGTQAGAVTFYQNQAAANASLGPQAVAVAGGSLPHNNMMPYLALNYCIALQGVFPPRP
jgi:microcystin-dependent protein